MDPLARALILAGLGLVALGLLVAARGWLPWLGHLPGDIHIQRPGVDIYLPLMTCLVLSAALTAVLWVAGRLR